MPSTSALRGSRVALAWLSALVAVDAVGYPLLASATHRVASSAQTENTLAVAALVLAPFGALIAARRPGNRAGWLLLTAATGQVMASFPVAYGRYAEQHPGRLPLGRAVWTVGGGGWWLLPFFVLPLLVLVFPDGEARGRSGRSLYRAVSVAAAASVVTVGLAQNRIGYETDAPLNPAHGYVPNAVTSAVLVLAIGLLIVATVVALMSLLRRSRGSTGVLRAQHRWLGVGVAGFAVLTFMPGVQDVISYALGLLALVGCLTVAILRYRLYDLGRLVSRTVSYALLSALLAGCYLAGIVLTTKVLPFASSFGVAASTLAVAALFQPARRRIQHAVDRRFNRARYDADRVVDGFAGMLRDAVDLDTVTGEFGVLVHRTVQPDHLSLWLAPGLARDRA